MAKYKLSFHVLCPYMFVCSRHRVTLPMAGIDVSTVYLCNYGYMNVICMHV